MPAPPHSSPQYPPVRYAWYVVAVLLLAYISSMVDRVILGYLVSPIKKTFGVTDSHVGMLMGIAFTLFYTLLGLPAGRLADRATRRTVIAVGITLWCFATVWCGVAQSFAMLFVGRVLVGVGEATLGPCAYSLISDYFPTERRTTALSVYSMGISVGNGTAVLLAGTIAGFVSQAGMLSVPVVEHVVGQIHAWQYIFILVGLPGLAVAALMFTVREPERKGLLQAANGSVVQVSFRQTLHYMKAHKMTFFCHSIGFGMFSIFNQGVGFWMPEFFIRTFAWQRPQIALAQGTTSIVFGTLGLWAGSRYAQYLRKRGHTDANMRTMLAAACGLAVFGIVMPQLPTGELAALCFIPLGFFGFAPYGAATAAVQEIMPNQCRGQAGALFLFIINLIGGGLGPLLVSGLTDGVFRDAAALRYSMSIVATAAFAGAITLFWVGLPHFRRSVGIFQRA